MIVTINKAENGFMVTSEFKDYTYREFNETYVFSDFNDVVTHIAKRYKIIDEKTSLEMRERDAD